MSTEQPRHTRARKSWEKIPFERAYFTERQNKAICYDGRRLAFLRPMIHRAFYMYPNDKWLCYTNADAYIAYDFHTHTCGLSQGLYFSRRVDIRRPVRSRWVVHDIMAQIDPTLISDPPCVDMLIVHRTWWWEHGELFGNLVIGCQGWDYVARKHGKDTVVMLTAHELHQPHWKNHMQDRGQLHNRLTMWEAGYAEFQPPH